MTSLPIQELIGRELGTRVCSYDERDAILYALAVGAHAEDISLVYEKQLTVLPTYPLALGLWAVWATAELGAYDVNTTLHVGQQLTVHRGLESAGSIKTSARVDHVWDKGSAALVDIVVTSDVFDAVYTIFVPGGGGFGGERGSSATAAPETEPTLTTSFTTRADQAALYRLTGDRHPVHIDPAAAAASGFNRPILHGLCTLGCAALTAARALDVDPASLKELTARISAPVFPGDKVTLDLWSAPDSTLFRATDSADKAVLSGSLTFG